VRALYERQFATKGRAAGPAGRTLRGAPGDESAGSDLIDGQEGGPDDSGAPRAPGQEETP